MSNQEVKDLLLTIIANQKTVIANQKSEIDYLKTIIDNQNKNFEVVETTYQRTEDVGKKFDELINITGTKKPKITIAKKSTNEDDNEENKEEPKKKPKAEKKVNNDNTKIIKNILKYFKIRYNENENVFDAILEENQAKSIFAEKDAQISAKKNEVEKQKERTNVLYKSLTADQKKKIREKMNDENEAASINDDDDIEEEAEVEDA
jgi:hypothetical protein